MFSLAGACCYIPVDDNKHARDRGGARYAQWRVTGVLAFGIATTPIAHAQNYYLARAIGEPVPTPAAREPAPPRNATPDLPGLGTEQSPAAEPGPSAGSSTWKWVVGIAVTAAVIALAKGGDGGDSGSGGGAAPSGGGGDSGASGGSGSGGGAGRPLPRLPSLGDDD